MLNAIYIELYKIFHKKNLFIFMGIILLISLLASKASQSDIPSALSMPTLLLQVLNQFLMPLFVSIWVAEIFTGEIRSGTLKIFLTRPISRNQLYLSKVITILVLMGILYLFTLLIGYVMGGIFLGFAKQTSPVMTGKSIFMEYLVTTEIYFLSIFPMFAFACVISLIALWFRKEGSLIAVAIFLIYVFNILSLPIFKFGPYIITTYFKITETLVKSPTMTINSLLLGWGVVLGYIVIPTLVGSWVFNQKDIAG